MVSPQIELLKVNFRGGKQIPNPTRIINTGEWYLLDHISSGLIRFDHERKAFLPSIASSWEIINENHHRFHIDPHARFHDGTSIRAIDIEYSIKNLLIHKTSTHFPLWQNLIDCDHLKQLNETCLGVTSFNETTIDFKFRDPMQSFYLQLASPETGIWHHEDLLQSESKSSFLPAKFSGSYFVDKIESEREQILVLKRNENSKISMQFTNSPKTIFSYHFSREEAIERFKSNQLHLFYDFYQPYGDRSWDPKTTNIQKSTPTIMIYLRKVQNQNSNAIGQDFVAALWKNTMNLDLVPADSFLPFGVPYTLNSRDFLSSLPGRSSKQLKIGYLTPYFKKEFSDYFADVARSIGIDLVLKPLEGKKFIDLHNRSLESEEFDFLLTPYAASERFPAVQLRFLTGKTEMEPPVNLIKVDKLNVTQADLTNLKNYQKWLLEAQLAIPVFLHSSEIVFKNSIDIGNQPKTDAEFELYRISKSRDDQKSQN